jgi:hypothetical protein
MLKRFLNDIEIALVAVATGATVNIFQGDDGNKYLVTWTSYPVSPDLKLHCL